MTYKNTLLTSIYCLLLRTNLCPLEGVCESLMAELFLHLWLFCVLVRISFALIELHDQK